MAHSEETPQITVLPPNKAKIKKLWMTALILLIITILEFIIAFTIPHKYSDLRVGIFVIMTIVKAGYIVGEFMHLRYEVKFLFWSILVPLIFIIWMLAAFVYEGMMISELRFF
jgi:cytochrome c oxidase subunit 4